MKTLRRIDPERTQHGKRRREAAPRRGQALWSADLRDERLYSLIERSSEDRLPELVPFRYGRMAESPFAFFRGTPSVMAFDQAKLPDTGLDAQICGDCHLENFGVFATPERNLIFDLNDFDETARGPWEWDVKRLAASFHVAGRQKDLSEAVIGGVVRACVRSYRKQMRACTEMTAFEVWYARVSAETLVRALRTAELNRTSLNAKKPAPDQTHEMVADHFTEGVGDDRRIVDRPPTIFHSSEGDEVVVDARSVLDRYAKTLREEVALLFSRYRLIDVAVKVVGIGSVGTRCAIALHNAGDNDPLLLQIKEARLSVVEEYAGRSSYPNHGQRVVVGQRTMQAASDMLLGWTSSADGHQYYVRQLADMKASLDVAAMSAKDYFAYAGFCGRVLAISHARSTDTASIAGYLGAGNAFDKAAARFAAAYADQVEADYQAFLRGVKSGRFPAEPE